MRVRIQAVYGIPQSATNADRTRMATGQKRPTKKPDCDNIEKVIMDALNGIAWHDDAQVVDIKTVKVYGEKPCVDVKISEE